MSFRMEITNKLTCSFQKRFNTRWRHCIWFIDHEFESWSEIFSWQKLMLLLLMRWSRIIPIWFQSWGRFLIGARVDKPSQRFYKLVYLNTNPFGNPSQLAYSHTIQFQLWTNIKTDFSLLKLIREVETKIKRTSSCQNWINLKMRRKQKN